MFEKFRRGAVFGVLGLAVACGGAEVEELGEVSDALTQSGATARLRMNDNWGSGFCATVAIENESANPITRWSVVLDSAGATVSNLWSGKFTQSGQTITVQPEAYNSSIAPRSSTSFGFCANGTGTPTITSMTIVGGGSTGGGSAGTGGTTSTGGTSGTGGTTSSGGTTSTGGTTSSGGSTSAGRLLSQDGNPTASWFAGARKKWGTDKADIVLSWQQSNGGWPKNNAYTAAGNGGNERGTFDNGATVTEIVYLAEIYRTGKNTKYRDAVRRAANFMLSAQYSTGGWPQFFPLRGGYSDHVTFNDNAMSNVLTVLHQAANKAAPFDTDVFTDADRAKFKTAVSRGVQYILKAQWKQNGKLTVWCAQHGKDDYKPKAARAYELESLSGSESVSVLGFLLSQPQTPEIEAAVRAGLAWYRSPSTYLDGYTYDSSMASTNPIVPKAGSKMWYRFYDLNTNRGFFSDRDGGKYYDITQISEERRTGYSWGGAYGDKIIAYATKVGY